MSAKALKFIVLLVVVGLLVACERPVDTDSSQETTEQLSDEPEHEQDQGVRMATFTGVIIVDPVAQGKRFQGVWLQTDDGKYVITYRARPRYLPYQRKRVVIEGESYRPGPEVQHIEAEHLRVESIELAAGESAHEPPPDEVLPPPVVSTKAGLENALKWVVVQGELQDVTADEGGFWHSATLSLDDGTTVSMTGLRSSDTEPGERTFVGTIHPDGSAVSVARSWPGRDRTAGLDLEP